METINTKNQTIWYDSQLLAQVPEDEMVQIFEAEYWQQREAILGSAQGRGTTWFIQLDGMQTALRHYRRGGLFGKLVLMEYIQRNDIHALSIKAFTPEEWARDKKLMSL